MAKLSQRFKTAIELAYNGDGRCGGAESLVLRRDAVIHIQFTYNEVHGGPRPPRRRGAVRAQINRAGVMFVGVLLCANAQWLKLSRAGDSPLA